MLAYLPCHLPKELVFLLVYWLYWLCLKLFSCLNPLLLSLLSVWVYSHILDGLWIGLHPTCAPKNVQAKTEGKHEENQQKIFLNSGRRSWRQPKPTRRQRQRRPIFRFPLSISCRYSSTPKAKHNMMDISTSEPRGRRAAGWPGSTGLSITPQQKVKNKTTKKEQIESTQATVYTQGTMPGCTGASGTPRRRGWNKAKSFFYSYPRRKNCMRIHQGWCAIWGWRRKNRISNQILSLAWFKKWSV